MSFPVDVNPAVLRWARESAGYGLPEVAERCNVSEHKLQAWESGKPRPTWPDLCRLAKLYKRPVTSLLLASPPDEVPPPADYRTLPEAKRRLSPTTRFAIRTARWLARTARLLEQQLGMEQRFQVPKARPTSDPEEIAQTSRQRMGVTIEEQIGWNSFQVALRRWRAAVEAENIFVFQIQMPLEEVRGFSLVEEESRVIVLNQADAVSARIFTLFHEYAHLLAAHPGVCIPEEGVPGLSQKVETFCNRFAAAFLVPRVALEPEMQQGASDDAINRLSGHYRVSRYVILGRMRALGAISQQEYQEITLRWQARAVYAPTAAPRRKGGPSRVARCLSQRGRLFASVVIEAAKREHIAANEATTFLGIRVNDLPRLESKVR